MLSSLRSIWIWSAVSLLIVLWLPLVGLIWLFDSDPVRYRTGRWFRRLGVAMTKVNPTWNLVVSGVRVSNPRNPYVVVSNHQSFADIPLISHLQWEMKWVAKKELFKVPFVGWLLRLAGDIPLDRQDRRSGARMLMAASRYLSQHCSVIFFAEGTRSPDGRVGRFNDGAFALAVKAQVPVLPIAVEGSRNCLPKRSWKFGPAQTIQVAVLSPVDTAGMTLNDVPKLRDEVRGMIVKQVAEWRGVKCEEVDALVPGGTR
jgi:1-acyl-sn-glycerol-3-phosphate acyltransferase